MIIQMTRPHHMKDLAILWARGSRCSLCVLVLLPGPSVTHDPGVSRSFHPDSTDLDTCLVER